MDVRRRGLGHVVATLGHCVLVPQHSQHVLTICHGPELNGVGPIPGLAGRSPSCLVRQLYDFQHGTRAGPWSPLMASNVIKLTLDDMVALAAYAASLSP
jgi:cytochrome c553